MLLFGDKHLCTACGTETKDTIELAGGQYLCKNCLKIVPKSLREDVPYSWSVSDFNAFKEHMETEQKTLMQQFNPDYRYGPVKVDSHHFTFAVDRDFVFKLCNIATEKADPTDPENMVVNPKYNFDFTADKVHNGFIGKTVTGNVTFQFDTTLPNVSKTVTCATKASGKVLADAYGEIRYEFPKECQRFRVQFYNIHVKAFEAEQNRLRSEAYQKMYEEELRRAEEEEQQRQEEQKHVNVSSVNDIQRALMLFMFDSVEEVTKDELKERRNKLLKSFHPDEGDTDVTKSQKINNAYQLLLSII